MKRSGLSSQLGRVAGFIVEGVRQRLVITAAHCLPHFPPSAAYSHLEERTYQDLLAPLGKSSRSMGGVSLRRSDRRHSGARFARQPSAT